MKTQKGYGLTKVWKLNVISLFKRNDCDLLFFIDVKKPLMGDLQEKQGVISLPANAPSQAIVDVSENMRAKIYALFCKLGTI